MASPKKKSNLSNLPDSNALITPSIQETVIQFEKNDNVINSDLLTSAENFLPDWEGLRNAIHAANWDTTLYPSDFDRVYEAALRGGAEEVRSIPWLGHSHLYADLVSRFLKK